MKKKYKLVQKILKTPKSSYDHGRFISSLIEHQIKHFHEVEKSLLKRGQEPTDISKIKTELQASKYLQKMTALLHPEGAEKRHINKTAGAAEIGRPRSRHVKRKS